MMTKTKHNLKRLIAMLLVVVTLVQWVPTDIFAVGSQNNAYIPGDVNGDGLVNALDVNLVRRYITGGYDVEINTLAADVNTDGYVTFIDEIGSGMEVKDIEGIVVGEELFTGVKLAQALIAAKNA